MKKSTIILILLGLILWVPYLTMLPHELGHTIWAFITGATIKDFSLSIFNGDIIAIGGIKPFISAGAYSTCIAIIVFLLSKYKFRGIFPSLPIIFSLILSFVTYARDNFTSGDFTPGLSAVVLAIIGQLSIILLINISIRWIINYFKKRRAANPNRPKK